MAENRPSEGKPISASEVNRFCYCPWQWYYEQVYGAAELRRRQKELLQSLGVTPRGASDSPLAKGRAFHENYVRRYRAAAFVKRLAVLLLLAAVLAVCVWVGLRYV